MGIIGFVLNSPSQCTTLAAYGVRPDSGLAEKFRDDVSDASVILKDEGRVLVVEYEEHFQYIVKMFYVTVPDPRDPPIILTNYDRKTYYMPPGGGTDFFLDFIDNDYLRANGYKTRS